MSSIANADNGPSIMDMEEGALASPPTASFTEVEAPEWQPNDASDAEAEAESDSFAVPTTPPDPIHELDIEDRNNDDGPPLSSTADPLKKAWSRPSSIFY